ncbi:hypothetical protein [Aliarcobacter butzleri]|uniref:hypothetical protein n=1 Tax=Aliarcobacter butzleri TaxID=28197 RepID=UPI00102DBFB1|nr:hypothetical protein [Aliarcobacter butzleri]RZV18646.1 hypothetical protein D3M75_04975 [Aliarcobacter butzleri]
MLKSLNDKFINSQTKTKIELYLLPLLLLLLISFYTFEEKQEEMISTKNSFDEISNKKFEGSYLEVLSTLENLANKNQITILTNEKDKESIFLKGKSKIIVLENYLKQIENLNNFSKVQSLLLYKKDENGYYFFDLKISFEKFYFKQLKNELELKVEDDALKKTFKEKEIVENNKFEINAIIDKYALINGNWIEQDEEIDGYKLVELQMYFVILENETEKIKLEVDHGEYFKNFN